MRVFAQLQFFHAEVVTIGKHVLARSGKRAGITNGVNFVLAKGANDVARFVDM